MNSRRVINRLIGMALSFLVPFVGGCRALHLSTSQPTAEVPSFQKGTNSVDRLTLSTIQAQVMRFADQYAATIAQATDDFSQQATNTEARLTALRWKLGQATAAYIDASGPNPLLNVMDTLVLVTLARMIVEEYAVPTFGEPARPWLEAQRKMDTNAWSLATAVIKPEQQRELRELIVEWRRQNPNQRYVGPIRFEQLVSALGKMPDQTKIKPNSVFSLLFIDPLAGLDPAAAALEETRMTAERAMYYAQRMPMLLSWQTEVLAYQLAQQPESQQLIADASRLAGAADTFAQTTRQLPQLVNDQRQAAIQQVLDGLADQENKAGSLLTESRQTFNSANAMAASINEAIKSLDQFVRYVSPPDTNPAPADTNSVPFNVLDYGRAAGQIGLMANDLRALLDTANQSVTNTARLSRQLSLDADRAVRHAFWRAVALILILLIGAVLAGLSYRLLASRLTRPRPPPAHPGS